jgi:enediyne biosynthesis thioesterase
MPVYEHRHVVGFEETSLVGNVYFTNYFLWQGHCRELFLREHCPEVLDLLACRDVAFFTRSATCDYVGDWGFAGLEEVLVRMRLSHFRGGRMSLEFTYSRADSPDVVVARGTQEVHCKARRSDAWAPVPFPAAMVRALQRFADTDELRGALADALAWVGADAGADGARG